MCITLVEWAQLRNFAVHFIVCCGGTSFKLVFLGGFGSRVVGSAFKMAVLLPFWVEL